MKVIVLLVVVVGSALSSAAVAVGDGPAWPAESPRVRLGRTVEIDAGKGGKGAKILRAITGVANARSAVVRRPYGVAWDGDDLLVTDPDAGRVVRLRKRPGGMAAVAGRVVPERRSASQPVAGEVVVSDPVPPAGWRSSTTKPAAPGAAGSPRTLSRPTGLACGEWRYRTLSSRPALHQVLLLADDGQPADHRRSRGERGDAPGAIQLSHLAVAAAADGLLGRRYALNFSAAEGSTLPTASVLASLWQPSVTPPGETPRIKGVAVDRDGHLWVTDAHLDQVALFRSDGTFLMDLGRRGDGPGEFQFPAGVAAGPDGHVAVVDSYNRRVQVFELLARAAERP